MGKRNLFNYFLAGLIFAFSSCTLENPSIGIRTDQIIVISTDVIEVLADGQSEVLVTATLGDESDANESISFRTEEGTFSGAAGFPNSNNGQELTLTASGKIAQAVLVTNTQESPSVTVSTTVGGYTSFTDLVFQRAYPDEMLIETSEPSLSITQGATLNLTVKLFRNEGFVSGQTRVDFTVSPVDTSQAVAEIIPFDFADANSLTVELRNGSDLPGLVEVLAEVKDKTGVLKASQTTIIEIK